MNAGLDRIIGFLARRPIEGRRVVLGGLGAAAALTLVSGNSCNGPSFWAFNSGEINKYGDGSEATFHFRATSFLHVWGKRGAAAFERIGFATRDPGFAIMPAEFGLDGDVIRDVQTMTFEIKGTISGDPNARLVVQVYNSRDDVSAPSIETELHPTSGYQAVTVQLDGKIEHLQKIQFILASETGSCDIQIRNIRFN